jgi:hypothetical protein
MRVSEFAELKAFAAVVERASFTQAADHLALSPSALSQTIRQLEARLAVRLLNRTTRSVAATAAGSRLHERIAGGLGGGLADTLALRWGALSRGNFALRRMTHEFWHHYQNTSAPAFFRAANGSNYLLDLLEFTQSPNKAPWIGAWNAELAVPRGPLTISAFMALSTGEKNAQSGQGMAPASLPAAPNNWRGYYPCRPGRSSDR